MTDFSGLEGIIKEAYEAGILNKIVNTYGGFKPFTAEQQAQYDKRVAEQKDWEEKFQKTYDTLAKSNKVLQLHKQDGSYCDGCDYGGYEGEPPEWPCRTVNLIIFGDANFHFEPPTPMPKSEYIPPKGPKTVTYTISPRNLEFGA